jgi:hypothetical protein
MRYVKHYTIIIKVTFLCTDLYNEGRYGTGNMIELFYVVTDNIPAYLYDVVNVNINDTDDRTETKQTLILPWLTGCIPSQHPSDLLIVNDNSKRTKNNENICTTIQPMGNLYSDVQ